MSQRSRLVVALTSATALGWTWIAPASPCLAADAPAPLTAAAATAPATQAAPVTDAKSEQVLRRMAAYGKALQAVSLELRSSLKMEAQDQKHEMTSTYALVAARPNKLALEPRDKEPSPEGVSGTVLSDGKQMAVYVPTLKKYATEDAPESLGDLGESPAAMVMGPASGAVGIVAALFTEDPYAKVLENVTRVTYGGEEEVDGVKCQRLDFAQADVDVRAWIEAGDRPVIHRLVPDLTKRLAANHVQGMKVDMVLDLTGWQINPNLPENRFAFTPPEGVEKAGSIMAMFGQGEEADDSHAKMIGQPAPAFELTTLTGSKVNLSAHKGKDVVILDFWATWCPPCVRALPIVAEVARSYAGKGVVFYAVNEGEDAPTIQDFLQKQKLDLNVLLDLEGKAGELYDTSAIPVTVIIARDGTVADALVGYNPQAKRELQKKIDALLAAKEAPATRPASAGGAATRPAADAAR